MEPIKSNTEEIEMPVSENATANPAQTPEAPATERRKSRRNLDTPPVPPPTPHLEDYRSIVGGAEIDELHFLGKDVKGTTVKMVNSTAVGGGVAEILNRVIPLLGEMEIPTHWDVITGGNDFYEVTKAFHNALHGTDYTLTRQAQEIFLSYNEQNRQRMHFDEDVVVIHDPQPTPLVCARNGAHNRWIWRCHIDLSNPNPEVWGFLRPYVERFDTAIFSSQSFTRQLPIPQ